MHFFFLLRNFKNPLFDYVYFTNTSFKHVLVDVLVDVLIEGCCSDFVSSMMRFFKFLILRKRSSQLLA